MEDVSTLSNETRITQNAFCGRFTSVADFKNFIPCWRAILGQFVTVQKYAMAGGDHGWLLEINELDIVALM